MISTRRNWLGLVVGVLTLTQSAAHGQLLVDLETAESLKSRIQWQTDLALVGWVTHIEADIWRGVQRTIRQVPGRTSINRITILGDAIIVQESGSIVALIQLSDGKVRWRQQIGGVLDLQTKPQLYNGQLLIAGPKEMHLLRMDNGDIVSTVKLRYVASTSPVVERGLAIFGSTVGRVFAHSMTSGLPQWDYQMAAGLGTAPVIAGGVLLATDLKGTVAALNPANGAVIWRRAQPPWTQAGAPPVPHDEVVYLASEDQSLYAIGRVNGMIQWQYMTEAPLKESPVVLGDNVLLPTRDQGLVSLNAADGTLRWRCDAQGVPIQQIGANIVVQDGSRITLVELKSGKIMQTFEIPLGQLILSPTMQGPADLIIARYDGRILKLSPK